VQLKINLKNIIVQKLRFQLIKRTFNLGDILEHKKNFRCSKRKKYK